MYADFIFAVAGSIKAASDGWRAALILVVGLVLAARIVRPLRRLHQAASTMAAGDLSERTGIDRDDEVGDVGRAFDSMAERLQDTVVKLQRTLGHLVYEKILDAVRLATAEMSGDRE